MKHIQEKNDWFYEFRPYICISLGISGILFHSLWRGFPGLGLLAFFSCLILIGAGSYVLSMRKNYRKTAKWVK